MKAGLKSGVLRVVICFCKSSVTVGTKGGYYYMPSPAGKGDREAVDEVRNCKDTAEAKSMVIFDLPKTFFHFAVRRNFTPQVFHLPLAANFTRRRRISWAVAPVVAPWGTAKRWMRRTFFGNCK